MKQDRLKTRFKIVVITGLLPVLKQKLEKNWKKLEKVRKKLKKFGIFLKKSLIKR